MIKNLTTILILFCLIFPFEPHNIEQTHFNHSSVFDSEYNKTNQLFYNTVLNRGYNLLGYTSKIWDNNNSDWVNYMRPSWLYDNDNNQIEYVFQTWVETDWLNSSKVSYTYDNDNN